MDHDFWHDKWQRKEIGFHQQSINQYLLDHWQALSLQPADNVFIPLCGKTKDIFWINEKGHPVLGVELSPIACKDLFEEANLTASVENTSEFSHYRHGNIDILCGDFFALTSDHLKRVSAIFDRAALIALPESMRAKYVQHLTNISRPGTKMLLVSMEYPQQEMSGPPFSVNVDEVQSLFSANWHIEEITTNVLGHDDPFAKRKGLSHMKEVIYLLEKMK